MDEIKILKDLYINKTLECERAIILVNELSEKLSKYANTIRYMQNAVNCSPKVSEKLKTRINKLADDTLEL